MNVCLCMMVKNEEKAIGRCIDSVLKVGCIDCYSILVDPETTDRTREIIAEKLGHLHGAISEVPWENFGATRTKAFQLAAGMTSGRGFVLMIDADETLETNYTGYPLFPVDGTCDVLTVDVVDDITFPRWAFLKAEKPWRYEGVAHEYVAGVDSPRICSYEGLKIVPHGDGARAADKVKKFTEAALLFEKDLESNPGSARSRFYLGQSWRDAGISLVHEGRATEASAAFGKAFNAYSLRSTQGGYADEAFYAAYQCGCILEKTKKPWCLAMEWYLKAHSMMPTRMEPLYRIGLHFSDEKNWTLALIYLSAAENIPQPDGLFIEHRKYQVLLRLHLAVCCHYLGKYERSIKINKRLIREGRLTEGELDTVIKNMGFSLFELNRPQKAA